jgi:hypothetical protein
MILMRMICNANVCLTPEVLHLLTELV